METLLICHRHKVKVLFVDSDVQWLTVVGIVPSHFCNEELAECASVDKRIKILAFHTLSVFVYVIVFVLKSHSADYTCFLAFLFFGNYAKLVGIVHFHEIVSK